MSRKEIAETFGDNPVLQAQGRRAGSGFAQLPAGAACPGGRDRWLARRGQYRFEHQDVRVMLWSYAGQCDWWISASSEESLKALDAGLLDPKFAIGHGAWPINGNGEHVDPPPWAATRLAAWPPRQRPNE